MPLIICPDCGKEISDQAPACLNCGRPTEVFQTKQAKNKSVVLLVFIVILCSNAIGAAVYFKNKRDQDLHNRIDGAFNQLMQREEPKISLLPSDDYAALSQKMALFGEGIGAFTVCTGQREPEDLPSVVNWLKQHDSATAGYLFDILHKYMINAAQPIVYNSIMGSLAEDAQAAQNKAAACERGLALYNRLVFPES